MAVNKVIYYGEVLVDMSQVTVTPETLGAGKTALNAAGKLITGTAEFGGGSGGSNVETCTVIASANGFSENKLSYTTVDENGQIAVVDNLSTDWTGERSLAVVVGSLMCSYGYGLTNEMDSMLTPCTGEIETVASISYMTTPDMNGINVFRVNGDGTVRLENTEAIGM